jgi:hypothetical protein
MATLENRFVASSLPTTVFRQSNPRFLDISLREGSIITAENSGLVLAAPDSSLLGGASMAVWKLTQLEESTNEQMHTRQMMRRHCLLRKADLKDIESLRILLPLTNIVFVVCEWTLQ